MPGKQIRGEVQESESQNIGEDSTNALIHFKSVVVEDLKDSANYFKFIFNSSQFLSNLKSDKSWVKHSRHRKVLKSVQEKIDMRISVDFTKSFETMAEGHRIIILEIENTI